MISLLLQASCRLSLKAEERDGRKWWGEEGRREKQQQSKLLVFGPERLHHISHAFGNPYLLIQRYFFFVRLPLCTSLTHQDLKSSNMLVYFKNYIRPSLLEFAGLRALLTVHISRKVDHVVANHLWLNFCSWSLKIN